MEPCFCLFCFSKSSDSVRHTLSLFYVVHIRTWWSNPKFEANDFLALFCSIPSVYATKGTVTEAQDFWQGLFVMESSPPWALKRTLQHFHVLYSTYLGINGIISTICDFHIPGRVNGFPALLQCVGSNPAHCDSVQGFSALF